MELLEKVEQRGRRPQQACATMFFLIPKNVTSERPNSLLSDSMVGGAEREEKRRQQRRRVGCDATDRRNGGAERTVWETLLEMERHDRRAGATDPAAITQVLGQGLRAGQSPKLCGLGRRRSNFPR